ncbi:MAG TPA: hypothetical protein VH063_04580 [Gaiellaceae bacterium]|nr:hypothetical protein [Gaiellaceae bacterium]
MELAPAILPAVCDLGDQRVRELGENALGRDAVRGQLDAIRCRRLLESVGRQLDETRAKLLGIVEGRGDGDPDQRNALFSFSKKPW